MFAASPRRRIVVAMLIASVKAGCVAWVFMDLRRASPAARLFAASGLLWLAILLLLTLGDYLTRDGPLPSSWPRAEDLNARPPSPMRSPGA